MAGKFYQIFVEDEGVDEDFYADVQSLEVEDNGDMAGVFTLRLTIRKTEDGEWTYLDDDRFALFNHVAILAGFENGNTEYLFDGYITQIHPHFDSAINRSSLEIRGMDATVLMSLEEKVIAWPDMSDSDIAQIIFGQYTFTPQVDSTSATHQETDITVIQKGTDIAFLKALARKNGFECFVERDRATEQVVGYFRRPKLDDTPQNDLAIQFGDDTNLISFDVDVDGLRPLQVDAQQVIAKDKTTTTASATRPALDKLGDLSLSDLVSGKLGSLVTPKVAAGKMLVQAWPTGDTTELGDLTQGRLDEASWFVTARGEINSNAYGMVLRSRRLVLVKGAGRLHSGKYYVTRVVHRLRADGSYTQAFEARRNALGLDGSEQFGGGLGLSLPF